MRILVDDSEDIFCVQNGPIKVIWLYKDHGILWVKIVMPDLGFNGILTRTPVSFGHITLKTESTPENVHDHSEMPCLR
jgi:hypothetical protein